MSDSHPAPTPLSKRGAQDAGQFFRYMAEFVGLSTVDAAAIARTRTIIEKHLPGIVAKFYTHLLRYPATRKHFLKKDGAIDRPYVEQRMRHLANFWLRSAGGVFDDDYASYVDYVGRAHTAHGADPGIYVPQRYVIGQVAFMQHAISLALQQELSGVDEAFEDQATEAWDKLMMVIMEMLSRAYPSDVDPERYDAVLAVDEADVAAMAAAAVAAETGPVQVTAWREVDVAAVADIPTGQRLVVTMEGLSFGVFHEPSGWYAAEQSLSFTAAARCAPESCRTGCWCAPGTASSTEVATGKLLVDPASGLDTFPVEVRGDRIVVRVPQGSPPAVN